VYDPATNPSGYAWAYSGATALTYNKPADANAGCAKNYVIFIGNGWTSQPESTSTNLTRAAADLSTAVGRTFTADTTQIYNDGTHFDEYARFMYQVGVPTSITDPTNSEKKLNNSITTYTIDVCKGDCSSGQEPNQTKLLKSVATVGGGKYFQAKSSAAIKTAFATILAEIQAVNSVFASATLPISVNTQGTYENQVYIGVFRPDASARQRWFGNLKQYKFGRFCDFDGKNTSLVSTTGLDKVLIDSTRTLPLTGTFTATDERVADDVAAPDCGYYKNAAGANLEKIPVKLYLADQDGYRAIDESGNTGFIDLSAKSYWSSANTYWAFSPTASGNTSDSPDGPEVERGGAAQKLRTLWGTPTIDGRKLYTCLGTCLTTPGTALSSHVFATTNSDVTSALAAPSGSATSVSLSRTGNTVTATASAHSFSTSDSVTISGATPTAYNGTFTVTKLSATQFTYTVNETPPTSGSGTIGIGKTSISSITLSGTGCTSGACYPGKTVTATMVAGAAPANPTTVSGTSKSYLDGSKALVSGAGTTTVTYSVTTPAAPAASVTDLKAGDTSAAWDAEGLTAAYNATTNTFTVTKTTSGNYPNDLKLKQTGASIYLESATESLYNGWWTLASNASNTVMTFNYATYSGCSSSTCTGAKATTASSTSDTMTFVRALGSTTVTGTRTTNNLVNLLGATISVDITDTAGNYTGTHVLTANDDTAQTFSFSDGVTLGPTPTTATGSAIAAGTLGGPTTANLINWMRGKDLWEDENNDRAGTYSDVRASIHGDVLHARPVMVNYGGTVGIVGFYGSNDGYLRAIASGSGKAAEPSTRTDSYTDDGNELWGFIPTEFLSYSKLSRAYLNSTSGTSLIRYPNQSCGITTTPTSRDYRWDGPITAYQSTTNVYYTSDPATTAATEALAHSAGCSTASTPTCYARPEKTWVFAAMRRGGRAVYALDVSVPSTPKIMWRIDNTSTGFTDLAQTWSEPKVAKLKGTFASSTGTITNPVVLVFGAGYDAEVEDQPSGTIRTPTKGYGVYVVYAATGELIQQLLPPTGVKKYSFPGDVNLLDMDNDGYIDRIYAGDTNANIFRWNLNSATVTNTKDSTYWTTYHVASLGDVGDNGGDDARKIHFPPEVLPFKIGGVTKVMVLVGTGDREKPLANLDSSSVKTLASVGGCSTYFTGNNPYPMTGVYDADSYTYFGPRVKDQFFGIVDVGGTAIVESELKLVNSGTGVSAYDLSDTTKKGWRIRLKTDPDGTSGDTRGEEKAVNAAKVVAGTVYFASNVPVTPNTSAGICSNLGTALGYAVNPFTGAPAINRDDSATVDGNTYTQADYATKFSGGGLPPTVTAGVVTVGGTPYRFIIGSGGSGLTSASSVSGQRNIINLRGTRSRLYWSYGADN
jgi:type IV pilus assembly protein PilY1